MSSFCDLHTHSVYSDGTFTPARTVALAKKLGLTVALTDHNTAAGLPEFMAEAQKQGVTAVPGVELSTFFEGHELHLLGLFIPSDKFSEVDALVEKFHRLKDQSNRDLIKNLCGAGYVIDYEAIKSSLPGGNVNRAHVASAMVKKGYIESVDAAFSDILRAGNGFYTPPERLKLTDAVPFLLSIGAIPILAHPLNDLSEKELRALLPSLISVGLLGMETVHSSYVGEDFAIAARIAEEFGLLQSGGSDFHGANQPGIELGNGKGNMSVPIDFYRKLLEKSRELYRR